MSELYKPFSLLDEVEEHVDRNIPMKELSRIRLDQGILHLLRCYEDHCRITLPQYCLQNQNPGFGNYQAGLKLAQDSMQFAMHWIHSSCLVTSNQAYYGTDPKIYDITKKLRISAEQYSRIWDFLTLARKDWASLSLEKSGELKFVYSNLPNPAAEVVDNILFAPDPPNTENLVQEHFEQLSQGAEPPFSIHPVGKNKITYKISADFMDNLISSKEKLLAHLWELDSDWDLGSYSVRNFQKFWVTLLSYVSLHYNHCTFASGRVGVRGGAIDSLIMVKGHQEWANELSSMSGLSIDATAAILEDLVYQPDLYFVPGKKDPDVTCQPFFRLTDNLLAVSNQLVMMSNADRNIWELVSILRPSAHSVLRNKKESKWINQLIPFFEKHNYFAKAHLSLGDQGDIDLLIIDRIECFGVVFQLKWLAAPDRINQVGHAAKEFEKGLDQAKKALKWISSNQESLASRLGLEISEIQKIEFQGIVLSKNTTGGGRVYDPSVPIISERLVKWVIDDPWRKRLRILYEVSKGGTFYPKKGKHYDEFDTEANFASLKFRGENFGMTWKGQWDPKEDMGLN